MNWNSDLIKIHHSCIYEKQNNKNRHLSICNLSVNTQIINGARDKQTVASGTEDKMFSFNLMAKSSVVSGTKIVAYKIFAHWYVNSGLVNEPLNDYTI